jgi:hypothetical protein
MRPDEAFGLLFNFDNVVANTRQLQRQAWQAVAAAEGLPFPSLDRPQLYNMRPERAATDVLMWTRDWKRAQEIAWLVATEYGKLLLEVATPLDGVAEWLQVRGCGADGGGMGAHQSSSVLLRQLRHWPPVCLLLMLCPAAPLSCAADEQDKGALCPHHHNGPAHNGCLAGQAGPAPLLLLPRHRCAPHAWPSWPGLSLGWPGSGMHALLCAMGTPA